MTNKLPSGFWDFNIGHIGGALVILVSIVVYSVRVENNVEKVGLQFNASIREVELKSENNQNRISATAAQLSERMEAYRNERTLQIGELTSRTNNLESFQRETMKVMQAINSLQTELNGMAIAMRRSDEANASALRRVEEELVRQREKRP